MHNSDSPQAYVTIPLGEEVTPLEVIMETIGAVNRAERVTGLQMGVVNMCKRLRGLQLGLVNIARSARLPVTPVLNASF